MHQEKRKKQKDSISTPETNITLIEKKKKTCQD